MIRRIFVARRRLRLPPDPWTPFHSSDADSPGHSSPPTAQPVRHLKEEVVGAFVSPVEKEIEALTLMTTPSKKSEMVHFMERVRRLLFTHERAIVKEHLMAILDKIHELGQALKGPQLQGWSLPLWRLLSLRLVSVTKACSVSDIARVFEVYAIALSNDAAQDASQPKGVAEGVKELETLQETAAELHCNLLKVLDVRLRQTEGKEHLPLKGSDLVSLLTILCSVAQIRGCTPAKGLIDRLLIRATSNPELWSDEQIVAALDALIALRFRDGRPQFSAFIVKKLDKNDETDKATLCAIVHKMGFLRPKKYPNACLNAIILRSLQHPSKLSMQQTTDFMEGLVKLGGRVHYRIVKYIADQFLDRSTECTPQQLALFTFHLASLCPVFSIGEHMTASASELARRTVQFRANDLSKILLGFIRLHFHPGGHCLQRVMDHAIDILLGDDILQPQLVDDYVMVDEWRKMRGFTAEAKLDSLDEPYSFKNRKTMKDLKKMIAESYHVEDPKYRKCKMENFRGDEIASLLFALAQLDTSERVAKFFEFTKQEIMRDALQLDAYELSYALWATAVAFQLDQEFLTFTVNRIEADVENRDAHLVKVRLGRCLVSFRVLQKQKRQLQLESDSYLYRCYHTWLQEQLDAASVPEVVQEAERFLAKMGMKYQLRATLLDGLFVADIVSGMAGQQFALLPKPDVLENSDKSILGEARWRFEILKALRKTVLYIDEDKWYGTDDRFKEMYVTSLTGRPSAFPVAYDDNSDESDDDDESAGVERSDGS